MKKTVLSFVLVVMLLTLLLAACSPRDQLYGKWRADQGGYLVEFKREGVLRMGEGLVAELKYEFLNDATIRVATGASIGLNLSGDIAFSIDGSKLVLTVAGQPLPFTRVP